MPRKALFTKEVIVAKALQIVRKKGQNALTARELGAALGSSARPIFTIFKTMDEVNAEVKIAAKHLFANYVADVTRYFPALKEFGMRLVRFAKEENNLFRYLFLQTDSAAEGREFFARQCLNDIKIDYNLNEEQVTMLFRQMWIYTCGLAALCSQESNNFPEPLVSQLLTLQFASTLFYIKFGRRVPTIEPHLCNGDEPKAIDFLN